MPQRLLQILRRIEVVLEKKLHGPLSSFTALTHIRENGLKASAAKGNCAKIPSRTNDWEALPRTFVTLARGMLTIEDTARQRAFVNGIVFHINPTFCFVHVVFKKAKGLNNYEKS